ncbi:hypothetical protein VPH35_131844 [Triticum aestivum]
MDMERGPEEVALGALGLAGFCRETLCVTGPDRVHPDSRPPGFAILTGEVTMLTLSLLAHITISRSLFSHAFASSHTGAGLLRLATKMSRLGNNTPRHIVVQWLGASAFCVFSVAPRYGVTDDRDRDARSIAGDLRTVPRFLAKSLVSVFRGDSRSAACLVRTGRKFAGRLEAIGIPAFLLHLGSTVLYGATAWFLNLLLLKLTAGEESSVQLARGTLLLAGSVYFTGAAHVGAVWRVASVTRLLADAWDELLLLARMSWAKSAVLTLDGCIVAVQLAFGALVVDDVMGLGVWLRVAAGVVMAVALWTAVMAGLVAQVVLFFVCKRSYHREREL